MTTQADVGVHNGGKHRAPGGGKARVKAQRKRAAPKGTKLANGKKPKNALIAHMSAAGKAKQGLKCSVCLKGQSRWHAKKGEKCGGRDFLWVRFDSGS